MTYTFVRRHAALIGAVLVLVLSAAPVIAQTGTTAIYGQVSDSAGALIVGAQVTLENAGTKATRTAATDSTGEYRFSSLPPGTYILRVEMKGFRVAQMDNLQ